MNNRGIPNRFSFKCCSWILRISLAPDAPNTEPAFFTNSSETLMLAKGPVILPLSEDPLKKGGANCTN